MKTNLIRGLLSVMVLSFTTTAVAVCDDLLEGHGALQIDRQYFADTNWCVVSVHPRDAFETLVYRDYSVTNDGLLMVFNSYGPGPDAEKTGAREYYFFPRAHADVALKTIADDTSDIQVQLSSGKWLSFSPATADISNIQDGAFSRDPNISPDNQGGIEIKSYDGIYLDAGFALGHSPVEDQNGTSTFHDSLGQSCQVSNQKVFVTANENTVPRSDSEISKYLKAQCPKLVVNF